MNRHKLSLLRSRLRDLLREREACEKVALQHHPMVAASFLERTFRPSQKRPYYYLSAPMAGVSRHRYVPASQAPLWRGRAYEWLRYRKAMTRWVRLSREIERALRAMGRQRCVAMPKASLRSPSPPKP
jgi:hypothetical protein